MSKLKVLYVKIGENCTYLLAGRDDEVIRERKVPLFSGFDFIEKRGKFTRVCEIPGAKYKLS